MLVLFVLLPLLYSESGTNESIALSVFSFTVVTGFTFFFVAGQLYVDEKAPASLRNSAQGFISFATYGVGKYLGTLVAGNVVHKFDLGDTYNWTAVWTVPLLMAIVFTIGFIVLFKEDVQKR